MKIFITALIFILSIPIMAKISELPEGIFQGDITSLGKSECAIEIKKVRPMYGDQNIINYSVQIILSDYLDITFVLINFNNQANGQNNSTILTYENLIEDNSKYQLEVEFSDEDIISYKLSSTEKDMLVTCEHLE